MTKPAALIVLFLTIWAVDVSAAETLAIVGGTVIDGNGGAPIKDGVIVIQGARIAAVGGHATVIPTEARRILAAGQYVIPGLMDANVHLVLDAQPLTLIRFEGRYDELAIEAAQLALRNGVTTVFDSWGPRQYLVKARNAINAGNVIASRIYLAGNIVGLGGPLSKDFWGPFIAGPALDTAAQRLNALWQENVGPELLWMSPEEVRSEVRRYIEKGDIDFLKYAVNAHSLNADQYIAFSPRVQQVIVEEARRAGLRVETHTTSGEGLYLAVAAGVDLMQHCEFTGQQPIPAETVKLIALRQIPCAILPETTEARAWYRDKNNELDVRDLNERALIRAGARIVLSTDSGVFSPDLMNSTFWKNREPPGGGLLTLGEAHFSWLRAVEEKGMKPMEALLAATRNIAIAYGVNKDLGTLEKGKIADLLILDASPLESAANYRSINLVMKDGNVVDRASLPTQRLLTAE
jgi:imidazolonepropionase-like amidohydrolase